jgi:hypothetical protein
VAATFSSRRGKDAVVTPTNFRDGGRLDLIGSPLTDASSADVDHAANTESMERAGSLTRHQLTYVGGHPRSPGRGVATLRQSGAGTRAERFIASTSVHACELLKFARTF